MRVGNSGLSANKPQARVDRGHRPDIPPRTREGRCAPMSSGSRRRQVSIAPTLGRTRVRQAGSRIGNEEFGSSSPASVRASRRAPPAGPTNGRPASIAPLLAPPVAPALASLIGWLILTRYRDAAPPERHPVGRPVASRRRPPVGEPPGGAIPRYTISYTWPLLLGRPSI
jgi:hypothetical protein